MLEILRDLLETTESDLILNHYLDKAKESVRNYLNYSVEEFVMAEVLFQTQIIDLAYFYYSNRDSVGLSQKSQGSRSASFEKGIPLQIKESLPLPKIRVV